MGEVGTQGSKPDAPCQTMTEVKAGNELGRGTHASPHSAFNDPCGTTAAWGVPKLNTRRLPSCPDTTLSPDHLSKTRETGVHHGVEEGCAFLTPPCVSLSSWITTQALRGLGNIQFMSEYISCLLLHKPASYNRKEWQWYGMGISNCISFKGSSCKNNPFMGKQKKIVRKESIENFSKATLWRWFMSNIE